MLAPAFPLQVGVRGDLFSALGELPRHDIFHCVVGSAEAQLLVDDLIGCNEGFFEGGIIVQVLLHPLTILDNKEGNICEEQCN